MTYSFENESCFPIQLGLIIILIDLFGFGNIFIGLTDDGDQKIEYNNQYNPLI